VTEQAIQDVVSAIVCAFGGDDPGNARAVPRSQVVEWMQYPALEVQGAIYTMVADAQRAKHIKPALTFEDYYRFVVPYLLRCIEQNPDMEWVESSYLAGYALVAWIVDFWDKKTVSRKQLADIKQRLAALYKRGDLQVRDTVVNAVLEHLFEQSELARYFKDWQSDPVLAPAYADALLWVKKNSKD